MSASASGPGTRRASGSSIQALSADSGGEEGEGPSARESGGRQGQVGEDEGQTGQGPESGGEVTRAQAPPQCHEKAAGRDRTVLPYAPQQRAGRGERGGQGHQGEAHHRHRDPDAQHVREQCHPGAEDLARLPFPAGAHTAHPYPLIPELAMPSTRNRWNARKNSTIGRRAITDMANIGPNAEVLDASTKDRSARVRVNFSGENR